jgi:hypothetical protein
MRLPGRNLQHRVAFSRKAATGCILEQLIADAAAQRHDDASGRGHASGR